MSLLSLDRVSKRFNGVPAVDGVSFTVDRGQVVGFLGPNGAGKSTTMRMITQYFEPDTGVIRLDGTSLTDAGREAKRRIGYLPESNPLYPEMLVSEWLDYIASPEANAMATEYFGEAPSNEAACEFRSEGSCEAYHAGDEEYASQIWYWTTPITECVDGRTDVECVDYSQWTEAWSEIKG